MTSRLLPLLLASCLTPACSQQVTLPAGTQLPVSIPANLPMKVGTPIKSHLLYPVYNGDRLVLPAGIVVTGSVTALRPDHSRRVNARLRGDFTPFDIPVVHFDSIQPPTGPPIAISTTDATDGAPIYRLVAPPPRKGGFLSQRFGDIKQAVRDRVAVITGPDKADRFQQFLYSQLPVHPQRIVKATAWTVDTSAPVTFALNTAAATPAVSSSRQESETPTWIVQGYLDTPISSASSHTGDLIHATVAEPILNPDGSVAVPQGSVLTGSVTQAHPARSFARAGQLRFSFRELTLPGGDPQSVRASLRGADSSSASQLAMDSEGEVKPKTQDKILVPLLLIALAGRPLDRDGGRHQFGKDASGSNAIGSIGFIVGVAARQPYLAAAIGYYGAALAIYHRIFERGKEVVFVRDTRVVIQTTPTRGTALKADSTP